MKKIILLVLILSIVTYTNPNIASAQTTDNNICSIEYISDDIYIETIITEQESLLSRTTISKTASKISHIKNSDGDVLASFELIGSFIYDHSTSRCTNASCITTVNDEHWKFTSTSATKSEISANGSYTIKCYALGFEMNSISRTLTISCDAHGNVY